MGGMEMEEYEDMEDSGDVPGIGDKVPDFELDGFQGGEIKKYRLQDFKGKWLVLAFYPADFTLVCPTELEELANMHDKFRAEGAEILGISTDTAYAHKAWHSESEKVKKVKYPMLADPAGRFCMDMGTYNEKEGMSHRATFIVDPRGLIKSLDMHDDSIGRSASEILRRLQAAKFVLEHRGKLCPANWHPGETPIILKGGD